MSQEPVFQLVQELARLILVEVCEYLGRGEVTRIKIHSDELERLPIKQ